MLESSLSADMPETVKSVSISLSPNCAGDFVSPATFSFPGEMAAKEGEEMDENECILNELLADMMDSWSHLPRTKLIALMAKELALAGVVVHVPDDDAEVAAFVLNEAPVLH